MLGPISWVARLAHGAGACGHVDGLESTCTNA